MRLTHKSKKTAVKRLTALLRQTEELDVAVVLFQALDMICDAHQIEMPEDAVSVNIGLDNFFGCDVLRMR